MSRSAPELFKPPQLKLDSAKPGASVLWETGTKPTTTISTPVFQDDGHFYAILGNGSLACLEAANGKEVWSTREPTSGSFGNAHLTPNGDRVFLFNHTGHLIEHWPAPEWTTLCDCGI